LLGALLGLLESIGFTFEGDDLAIVGEAIDQGDNASGVGEGVPRVMDDDLLPDMGRMFGDSS